FFVKNLFGRALVCVAALALLPGGAARAASVEVKVENIVFVPAEVTIFEGDTVVWTWANGTHSTTSEDCMCGCTCLWASGGHATGPPAFQFEYPFDTAGDYAYYCQVHVARGMVATVHVLPAPGKVAAQKAADRPAGLALLGVGLCGCGVCGYARYRR